MNFKKDTVKVSPRIEEKWFKNETLNKFKH